MLTLMSSGRITFLARNQQVGICLVSGGLSVQLSIASSLFIRSCIPVASMCCKVGRIFVRLISFLIKIVFLPPLYRICTRNTLGNLISQKAADECHLLALTECCLLLDG